MPGLVVNPRSRIFHGHDWVYASEVKKAFGEPQPGDVISLKDFRDRPLGSAIYNPASQIVARRFSRRTQDLDLAFFRRRLERAAGLRGRLGFGPAVPHRLVWSEADGLPGVVVDRYGEHFVLQTLTLGMDARKALVVEAITGLFGAASVLERNDTPLRKAEGLPLVTGVLAGADPGPLPVPNGEITFTAHLLAGHKTGLYLDQFDNYLAVAAHAPGRRVLDCFSNHGGFALHCARAGAASTTSVDISEDANAAARANAESNGLAIETVAANAFDYLKEKAGATADDGSGPFDLIVLDPPSFTRSKKKLKDAMRGYKEIHLRALQMLRPGGLLATFCCSHHVSPADFREVVVSACVDAKRTVREAAVFRQRADHPVVPTVPETEYLKGFLLEVMPGI